MSTPSEVWAAFEHCSRPPANAQRVTKDGSILHEVRRLGQQQAQLRRKDFEE